MPIFWNIHFYANSFHYSHAFFQSYIASVFICFSLSLFNFDFFLYLSLFLSILLCFYLCIYASVCMSVCPSIHPSILPLSFRSIYTQSYPVTLVLSTVLRSLHSLAWLLVCSWASRPISSARPYMSSECDCSLLFKEFEPYLLEVGITSQ